MVTPLAVLGLVVDRPALDLDFADRPGALVIGHIVQGLVKTKLLIREEPRGLAFAGLVADRDFPDFLVPTGRDEEEHLHLEPILGPDDSRVAHTVPALVRIELGLHGLPSGVPYIPAVVDVYVSAAKVIGHVVIAVSGQAAQARVLPKAVSASRVRTESEEIVLAYVIEPGQWRVGPRDHVLASRVVEMAVFHGSLALRACEEGHKNTSIAPFTLLPDSIPVS